MVSKGGLSGFIVGLQSFCYSRCRRRLFSKAQFEIQDNHVLQQKGCEPSHLIYQLFHLRGGQKFSTSMTHKLYGISSNVINSIRIN